MCHTSAVGWLETCACVAWRKQELGKKVPLSRDLLAALAKDGRPHCVQVLAALLQTSVEGVCSCCDDSFRFSVTLQLLLEKSTTGPLPVRVLGPQQCLA